MNRHCVKSLLLALVLTLPCSGGTSDSANCLTGEVVSMPLTLYKGESPQPVEHFNSPQRPFRGCEIAAEPCRNSRANVITIDASRNIFAGGSGWDANNIRRSIVRKMVAQ